jgi:hypothetical protein
MTSAKPANSMTPAQPNTLADMLRFIDTYQQQRPHLAAIDVVRELRAYTKPAYAGRFWEMVAGNHPDFVKAELDNHETVLAGKAMDFAHLIAALSDQAWGGNTVSKATDGLFWLSSKVLTGRGYDSREYTGAIGDTGQPIEVYLDKHGAKLFDAHKLADTLRRFASDQDYASDIMAFVIGRILYYQSGISLKAAFEQANTLSFTNCVRKYLIETFDAQLVNKANRIQNLPEVQARITQRLHAYLLIKRDALKGAMLDRPYWKTVRPAMIEQAQAHFLTYLLREGEIEAEI